MAGSIRRPARAERPGPAQGARPAGEATSRYFIALRPGPRARAALGRFAHDLAARYGGRAIAPQDIHLTLAFLGSTPVALESDLSSLVAALPAPGRIALARVGSFDGRLLWVAPPGDMPGWLDALATDLRARLDRIGVGFDRKRLFAHVTLVRSARVSDRAELAAIAPPAGASGMGATRAWLVQSTLSDRGSRYRWVGAPHPAHRKPRRAEA